MAIERLTPDHSLWASFCSHLERHALSDQVLTPDRVLSPGLYALCTVEMNFVIGHIVIRMQRIRLPGAMGTGPLSYVTCPQTDRPLRELFVQTFAVDEPYRRRGHGRALQTAAIDLGKRLGCFQLRSWSPLDCTANCRLKLSMGFSAHPTVEHFTSGVPRPGILFVKPLQPGKG